MFILFSSCLCGFFWGERWGGKVGGSIRCRSGCIISREIWFSIDAMVSGDSLTVARCFSVKVRMLLSRAVSNSREMLLWVMTSSRCSKKRVWYFLLKLSRRSELFEGMYREAEGWYFLGIVW